MLVLQVTWRKKPKQGLLPVSIMNTVNILVGVTIRVFALELVWSDARLPVNLPKYIVCDDVIEAHCYAQSIDLVLTVKW